MVNKKINLEKIYILFLFLAVCFVWGTTWTAIKFSEESMPPIFACALRFLFAFPSFFLLGVTTNSRLLPKPKEGKFFVIGTLFYFALPYGLINFGEMYVSSDLAALIFSSMPVLMLVFSTFMLKKKIRLLQVIGIFIALWGFYCILKTQGPTLAFQSAIGFISLFMAACMHAGYYVYVTKEGSSVSTIAMNTFPVGMAGVLLLIVSLLFEHINIHVITLKSFVAALYLGVFASVVGFLAYFKLLKLVEPIIASFVFLIFPVFAIIFSAWLEPKSDIHFQFILYFLVILFGFALTKSQTPDSKG